MKAMRTRKREWDLDFSGTFSVCQKYSINLRVFLNQSMMTNSSRRIRGDRQKPRIWKEKPWATECRCPRLSENVSGSNEVKLQWRRAIGISKSWLQFSLKWKNINNKFLWKFSWCWRDDSTRFEILSLKVMGQGLIPNCMWFSKPIRSDPRTQIKEETLSTHGPIY